MNIEEAKKIVNNSNSDGVMLAQVAYDFPQLHDAVISHKNVYESLLSWITVFSADPTVKKHAYERLDSLMGSNTQNSQTPVSPINIQNAGQNVVQNPVQPVQKDVQSSIQSPVQNPVQNPIQNVVQINTPSDNDHKSSINPFASSNVSSAQTPSQTIISTESVTSNFQNDDVQKDDIVNPSIDLSTSSEPKVITPESASKSETLDDLANSATNFDNNSNPHPNVDDLLAKYGISSQNTAPQSSAQSSPSESSVNSNSNHCAPTKTGPGGSVTYDFESYSNPGDAFAQKPFVKPEVDYSQYNQTVALSDIKNEIRQTLAEQNDHAKLLNGDNSEVNTNSHANVNPSVNSNEDFNTSNAVTSTQTPDFGQNTTSQTFNMPQANESKTHNFTIAQALDPNTDANTLADIAEQAPELREYIVFNRNIYPELLQWLSDLNDPKVNIAIKSRQS